ncbi:hypothetical protein [Gordonia alkanivorans]|uniref:hypothetical protein n=1 Tax=Gordonia alkanivorans TaxID=84096 RepID=UPI0004BB2DC1|nr:hypothetical protein [Gordonia alkanivorans]
MHTIVLVVAAIITLLLAAHAVQGGMIRAWVMFFLAVLPTFLLYMAFRATDNETIFLAPLFVVSTIILGKAAVRLVRIANNTPHAAVNAPARGAERPHWAVS